MHDSVRGHERPYDRENTASRLICEVKHVPVWIVVRWGTTREVQMLFFFSLFYSLSIPFYFFFFFLLILFFLISIFSFILRRSNTSNTRPQRRPRIIQIEAYEKAPLWLLFIIFFIIFIFIIIFFSASELGSFSLELDSIFGRLYLH